MNTKLMSFGELKTFWARKIIDSKRMIEVLERLKSRSPEFLKGDITHSIMDHVYTVRTIENVRKHSEGDYPVIIKR